MEQLEQIPIGQEANDKTGDPLRNGMAKVNANFVKVQTGVDAVELTAANAAQTATEAKTTADAAIPATQKGMAGGVAEERRVVLVLAWVGDAASAICAGLRRKQARRKGSPPSPKAVPGAMPTPVLSTMSRAAWRLSAMPSIFRKA